MRDVTVEPTRRATVDDLDELVVLAAEYCAADGHRFDERSVRAGFAPLLADDRHGVVRVVGDPDDPDALAGYAVVAWSWSIEIGGPEAVLDEVYVRTRGAGLGTALVEAAVAECRAHGMRRVFLETERPNHAARRLYARLGFAEDDSIWMSTLLTDPDLSA